MKDSLSPIITLDKLKFSWSEPDISLLKIDHLQIMSGERVFLRGPSGSGKSTLLSLIAGVLVAQSGSIEILGAPLESMSSAARDRFRANHIGIIFQQFNLIPYLSVVENVTLPCHFSRQRRQNAAVRSGSLRDEALRLLNHRERADTAVINKPVNELSVGQQQRVAAARALIGSPEILIADEPTSSMDADRRQAFINLLFQECHESGSTLLFVSHDQRLQEPFDRSIELDQLNDAAANKLPGFREVS